MSVTAPAVTALVPGPALPRLLAAEPRSPQVTDWAARLVWVAALLLCVALLYWLMRRGWQRRGLLHPDLPPLPSAPAPAAGAPALRLTGRYYGTTTAGQWLDRIVAHGLGTRSRAELTLTGAGLWTHRPGARDFFVPAGRLRGARLETGIAGKVLTEGGLLVITWEHGGRLLDSGFRSDRAAEHGDWVRAVRSRAAGPADGERADGEGSGGEGAATPNEDTAISPGTASVSPRRA